MAVSEDTKDVLAAGGKSGLEYAAAGAAAGSAIAPGIGTGIGAAVGLVAGFTMGAIMENRAQEEQDELDADIAKSEKEAAQFAVRQAKESGAVATMASATGRTLAGPVGDEVFAAAARGTGLDTFNETYFG